MSYLLKKQWQEVEDVMVDVVEEEAEALVAEAVDSLEDEVVVVVVVALLEVVVVEIAMEVMELQSSICHHWVKRLLSEMIENFGVQQYSGSSESKDYCHLSAIFV